MTLYIRKKHTVEFNNSVIEHLGIYPSDEKFQKVTEICSKLYDDMWNHYIEIDDHGDTLCNICYDVQPDSVIELKNIIGYTDDKCYAMVELIESWYSEP